MTSSEANSINKATINTLLIFTSNDGLSSGKYTFTKREVDINMDVYHLPFTYHFKSDTALNYFVVGNIGYSRIYLSGEIQELPEGTVLNYLNHIQTYTVGFGGGARYSFQKDLSIAAGAELIYSRAGASVIKPDGDLGDLIEDFFNRNYSDNFTYKFFSSLEYRPKVEEYKPYLTLSYKLYETKSQFSFSEVASFHSESSVTTLALGVESPQIYAYDKNNYLTFEGYYQEHYLSGTIRDVVNFRTYGNLGGVAYWYTADEPWWASRFFLELSSVISDGMEGYNVGVGFTLDF